MSARQLLRRLLRSHWDLYPALAALCVASMLLLYPFGRDQGLYHYVGREWLRGSVPYRDLMEQHSPLIFLVYGLASAVFGEQFGSVRLVELCALLGLGGLIAYTVTPRGEHPTRGLLGATTLAMALTYVGYLNFWNSGQCELWAAGFSVASLSVIERRASSWRHTGLAGLLFGLAVLAKPTALLLGPVLGAGVAFHGQLRWRTTKERVEGALRALGVYVLGAASALAVTAVYFAAHGAFGDLVDVLWRCNRYYFEHEASANAPQDSLRMVREFTLASLPLLDVVVAGLTVSLALGVLRRAPQLRLALYTLGAIVASTAGVWVQHKFFLYHWAAVLPWMVMAFALGADTLARETSLRARRDHSIDHGTSASVLVLALAGLYAWSFVATATVSNDWRRRVTTSVAYARGQMSRTQFLEETTVSGYDLGAQEAIGQWIAAHSDPDDLVALRNFEPAMYLTSRRGADRRFFWTPWIVWPQRAYRRAEWLADDERELRERPPRYVVAVSAQREGMESPGYYEPEYERRYEYGGFVVMEYTNTHLDLDGRSAHDHGRVMRVVRALGMFERPGSGLEGWAVEGRAMVGQPRAGAEGIQTPVTGFFGDATINTYDAEAGDAVTGIARSPTFTAPAGVWLGMLVGGGGGDGTGVELQANGQTVARWHGDDSERMRWVTHDLTPYVGRTLRVIVNDQAEGAWGHVLADHVVLLR